MDFRRRLSEGGDSFSEGTSRFFNSVIAKKNGLLSDLSNKFDSVGATLMKNSPSSSSSYGSDPESPTAGKVSSAGLPQDSSTMERTTNTYTDSRIKTSPGPVASQLRKQESTSSAASGNEENYPSAGDYPSTGANISFDEPLYSPSQLTTTEKSSTSVGPTWKMKHTPPIPPPPRHPSRKEGRRTSRGSVNSPRDSPRLSTSGRSSGRSSGHSSDSEKHTVINGDRTTEQEKAPKFSVTKRRSSTVDEMLFDDYVAPEPEPEPEDTAVNKRKTLLPMGNFISFDEPELEDFHPKLDKNHKNLEKGNSDEKHGEKSGKHQSVSSIESSELDETFLNQTSIDSSDVEFGGDHIGRLGSVGSERSWSSDYSLDSQPDDLTVECMGFMKEFVEKIFNPSEEITRIEKAMFGEYCQQVPGRQYFARYVNTQRVNSKKVEEVIFFQLVQYFAVVLFECNESEDFTPAKNLMNMCFTFYHESRQGKQRLKNFLYSYLKEQPIWQSLRFWNAAFFDAVQNERARKPVCTSEDGHDSQSDDNMFQENINFGQLGTFTCNMRAFGLSRDLCLEFLRKQAIIANLPEDQVKMLKDNVVKTRDH